MQEDKIQRLVETTIYGRRYVDINSVLRIIHGRIQQKKIVGLEGWTQFIIDFIVSLMPEPKPEGKHTLKIKAFLKFAKQEITSERPTFSIDYNTLEKMLADARTLHFDKLLTIEEYLCVREFVMTKRYANTRLV